MTKLRFSRIPSEDRDIWLFSSDLAPFYWESHNPLGEVIPSLHMLPLIILLIWTVSWSRGEHVTCVEPARLFSWDIWIYTMESMLISLWWSTCELRGSSRFIIHCPWQDLIYRRVVWNPDAGAEDKRERPGSTHTCDFLRDSVPQGGVQQSLSVPQLNQAVLLMFITVALKKPCAIWQVSGEPSFEPVSKPSFFTQP